jgi:hypothetical protein
MDADDIAKKERLERQCIILDSSSSIGICHSNFSEIDQVGKETNRLGQNYGNLPTEWLILWGNPIAHPSVMIRKSCLCGGEAVYESDAEPAEDYRLWTRFVGGISFYHDDKPLIEYRRYPQSVFEHRSKASLSKALEFNGHLVERLTRHEVPAYHAHLTSFGGVLGYGMPKVGISELREWLAFLSGNLSDLLEWSSLLKKMVSEDIDGRLRSILETEPSVYFAGGTRTELLWTRPADLFRLEVSWIAKALRRILGKVWNRVRQGKRDG